MTRTEDTLSKARLSKLLRGSHIHWDSGRCPLTIATTWPWYGGMESGTRSTGMNEGQGHMGNPYLLLKLSVT